MFSCSNSEQTLHPLLQLRKAYNRQAEEIKNLRNQLSISEKRIRELEAEVKRLQQQTN